MTVQELITLLETFPKDAEVNIVSENYVNVNSPLVEEDVELLTSKYSDTVQIKYFLGY